MISNFFLNDLIFLNVFDTLKYVKIIDKTLIKILTMMVFSLNIYIFIETYAFHYKTHIN